jgi:hypothetical protein
MASVAVITGKASGSGDAIGVGQSTAVGRGEASGTGDAIGVGQSITTAYGLTNHRRAKALAKRQREAAIRLARYEAVRDAKPGRTWLEAYTEAAQALASTTAKAAPETMAKAYKAAKKALDRGRVRGHRPGS